MKTQIIHRLTNEKSFIRIAISGAFPAVWGAALTVLDSSWNSFNNLAYEERMETHSWPNRIRLITYSDDISKKNTNTFALSKTLLLNGK